MMKGLFYHPFSVRFLPLVFVACSNAAPAEKPALPAPVAAPPKTEQQQTPAVEAAPAAVKKTKTPDAGGRQTLQTAKLPGGGADSFAVAAAVLPAPGPHESWGALLAKYVSPSGKVNYKGFKADKTALTAYLQALSDNPPQGTWSRAEKMAYWINAYNAFTIELICENYPLGSILKLDGGKTWDVKRIKLGGKPYSLNQIENEILRPQFKDARIHFAINCAAKSCPPLLNKAWTAANLEETLEKRCRQFVNDSRFNTLGADKAVLSKIFDWYAADFGDLKTFINQYAVTKLNANASLAFQEYDWDLND